LGKLGLALGLVLVLIGIAAIVPKWDELRNQFSAATDPSNWAWILVVYVAIKLIHETGHGLICKRFGGQVPEFGAMMLVLVPSPYVDASSAWAFESKWQRMAVGAGGMIFELAVASGATLVWRYGSGSDLLHQLAFNAMLTASVSTVLFNANPLMRFDGYYILSDLLEVPNLMQRSQSILKFLFQKFVYRIRGAVPPTSDPGEAGILLTYGMLAMAYRLFLFVSITLFVMGKMFGLGVILAAWTAAMWFILPAGAFVHWLATSPALAEKRPRAIAVSLLMIFAGLSLVGLIPMPDHRRAAGVVSSEEKTGVFVGTSGFVMEVYKRPGEFVKAGEPIIRCESPELESQARVASAQFAEAESMSREAMVRNTAAFLVAQERLEAFRRQIAYFKDKQDHLTVRAPHDGVIVTADPKLLQGSFIKEGQGVCEIVNTDPAQIRITAGLTQTEASWLFELNPSQYEVEARLISGPENVLNATTERILQAGTHDLAHPALGYAGGGSIELDAKDRTGKKASRAQFTAFFKPDAPDARPWFPGERVALRFDLPKKPWLLQWVDRLQKLMQGRAHV
jgi:putative peptide zinc metalloprotease protein